MVRTIPDDTPGIRQNKNGRPGSPDRRNRDVMIQHMCSGCGASNLCGRHRDGTQY